MIKKPICKIEKNNVEHLIVRVFETIRENYDLQTARKFYNITLAYRNDRHMDSYEIYEVCENLAREYVRFEEW